MLSFLQQARKVASTSLWEEAPFPDEAKQAASFAAASALPVPTEPVPTEPVDPVLSALVKPFKPKDVRALDYGYRANGASGKRLCAEPRLSPAQWCATSCGAPAQGLAKGELGQLWRLAQSPRAARKADQSTANAAKRRRKEHEEEEEAGDDQGSLSAGSPFRYSGAYLIARPGRW